MNYMGKYLFALTTLLVSVTVQAETRFDTMLDLHQTGKLIPLQAKAQPEISFLCYSRHEPNQPLTLLLSYQDGLVQDFQTQDAFLEAVVGGRLVRVQEGTVDGFIGTVMGGTSVPSQVAAAGLAVPLDLRHEIFIALSTHEVSARHLLAIMRREQDDKSTPNLCKIRQSVEYVCIQAEWGS